MAISNLTVVNSRSGSGPARPEGPYVLAMARDLDPERMVGEALEVVGGDIRVEIVKSVVSALAPGLVKALADGMTHWTDKMMPAAEPSGEIGGIVSPRQPALQLMTGMSTDFSRLRQDGGKPNLMLRLKLVSREGFMEEFDPLHTRTAARVARARSLGIGVTDQYDRVLLVHGEAETLACIAGRILDCMQDRKSLDDLALRWMVSTIYAESRGQQFVASSGAAFGPGQHTLWWYGNRDDSVRGKVAWEDVIYSPFSWVQTVGEMAAFTKTQKRSSRGDQHTLVDWSMIYMSGKSWPLDPQTGARKQQSLMTPDEQATVRRARSRAADALEWSGHVGNPLWSVTPKAKVAWLKELV